MKDNPVLPASALRSALALLKRVLVVGARYNSADVCTRCRHAITGMSRGMFPPPWNMAARIRAGRFTRFPLRCCSQGLSGRRTMCPLPAGCGWLRNSVGHAEIGANVGNPHDLVVRRCGPGMTHFGASSPHPLRRQPPAAEPHSGHNRRLSTTGSDGL